MVFEDVKEKLSFENKLFLLQEVKLAEITYEYVKEVSKCTLTSRSKLQKFFLQLKISDI